MISNSLSIRIVVLFVLFIAGCQPAAIPEISVEEESTACKQIVFSYSTLSNNGFESNIVSACPDGTEKRRLTSDTYHDLVPAWSPDGTEIAFLSDRSGAFQLHLMNHDGDNIRQITFGNNEIAYFIWFPDGNQIALKTTTGDGNWFWQSIDLLTKEITSLTDWKDDSSFQFMAFSHDGIHLVYLDSSNQDEHGGHPSQIRVQNKDGSNDYALTNDNWASFHPVWSPDDSQIAFISDRDSTNDQFDVYIANADGGNLHRVTEQSYNLPLSSAWSSDNRLLAVYITDSLYVLDLESGERTELFAIEYPNYISGVSWQP